MGCEVTSEKSGRSKKLTSVHVGSLQGIKHWLVDLGLESSLVDSYLIALVHVFRIQNDN